MRGDENGRKDFSPLIRRARELGGWDTDRSMSGINGGHILQTGFARSAVLSQAPQLLEAIRTVTKANIIGADLNELAPTLDPTGVSTATACKVLRETLIALDKGWPGFQV